MKTIDFNSFKHFLNKRYAAGNLTHEILQHDLGASIHRNRLTGLQEGLSSLNTEQLSVVVGHNKGIDQHHDLTHFLLLSAMVDGDMELFEKAEKFEVFPEEWSWLSWAKDYRGDAHELIKNVLALDYVRQRCAAVILATRDNPDAITEPLLNIFLNVNTATTYVKLVQRGLKGINKEKIVAIGFEVFNRYKEILFTTDTDRMLATLVDASDLDDPQQVLAPFQDAAGEWTQVACARRHLERGRPQRALDLVKELRFLSTAYDQAITVAALAALESKQYEMAELYCRTIEDIDLRLKIVTRLAQSRQDIALEVESLTQLFERNPNDGQIFVQLIHALNRVGQSALIKALCYQAQERYPDDSMAHMLIKKSLKA
jgi:tetratricopeptide (TPR) repeat protein